ncbi:response regulator [Trueperella sp. LYQ143]|uniref:response regulator transcription factor n=1 Tax=Trueperella sp. LYQ143 TaxID=3391059 RepID=UPI0039831E81
MLKVVLIDDESLIVRSLRFSIDWAAHDCHVVGEASDGAEGIELITHVKPDIVITDIKMPVMTGLEMLQNVKDRTSFATVILSGYDEFSLVQQALRLGVFDYILKPVNPDELAACIDTLREHIMAVRSRDTDHIAHQALNFHALPHTAADGHWSKTIGQILDFIHQHFAQRILLRDVAAHVGMSVNYMNEQFKAEVGTTLADYVNRYRIQQAVYLLTSTDMKVYQVAQAVGISDYKYFTRVFKRYVGHSPNTISRNSYLGS